MCMEAAGVCGRYRRRSLQDSHVDPERRKTVHHPGVSAIEESRLGRKEMTSERDRIIRVSRGSSVGADLYASVYYLTTREEAESPVEAACQRTCGMIWSRRAPLSPARGPCVVWRLCVCMPDTYGPLAAQEDRECSGSNGSYIRPFLPSGFLSHGTVICVGVTAGR